jgi:hypothetical protein
MYGKLKIAATKDDCSKGLMTLTLPLRLNNKLRTAKNNNEERTKNATKK